MRRYELSTALSLAILFAGAFLQGLTGFGYSLFSLPLLTFLMPVSTAVPMLCLTSVFLNLIVFLRARKSLDIKRILPLLISGAAALPAGIWLLRTADESALKIGVGVLVILSSVIYLSGFRITVRREKLAMIPVGFLSGLLNGATTFSGPPVILFFANQRVAKHQFRASLAAYFLLLNAIAVPAFIAGGLLTGETALNTLYLFPAVISGVLFGIRMADVVSEERFRFAALIALGVLGVFSVVSGL
ncbi:sulfite exporter TauE/SafE family protein [Candidatus Fermentibacteria bacterium]|nr:MAG: sulfite exporter TauE/SafE family protein [Candidatus Fermentibacteria bacterium]